MKKNIIQRNKGTIILYIISIIITYLATDTSGYSNNIFKMIGMICLYAIGVFIALMVVYAIVNAILNLNDND